MISLRIPEELERKLNSIAKSQGKSRSEIIKDSISEYIDKRENSLSPYELGKELFGTASSEYKDLATNRKKHLAKILKSKNEKRQNID